MSFSMVAGRTEASLVAYWSFDQQNITNDFVDLSGNNNTAVNNGNVTAVSGVVGNAAQFTGNGILTVADSPSLDSAAASLASRSVAFWFKYTTTDNLVVLEKGPNTHFVVQTESVTSPPGKISFRVDTNNSNRVISQIAVNDDTFHHFAATFDTSNNLMSLYIDGVLQATNTQASPTANDSPFVIGARWGLGFPFVGLLDELAVWNRPLTQPEVVALSQKVSPLDLFSTVALHPTYYYTGSIQPDPSSARNDPNRTKLTDGIFGSSTFDDGKWVAFRDPLGYGQDNGEPQPQIDFSFGLLGLRITDVQVQYLRQTDVAIYEPDQMVVEFYQDPAFTQLVDSYTITDFSSTDGVFWKTYRFPAPVYAEYARVKFYNDQEWTWLGEIMFFGSVPEPSTWVLLALGVAGLAGFRLLQGRGKANPNYGDTLHSGRA